MSRRVERIRRWSLACGGVFVLAGALWLLVVGGPDDPAAVQVSPFDLALAANDETGSWQNLVSGRLELLDDRCLVVVSRFEGTVGLALNVDRVHDWDRTTGRLAYGRQVVRVGQEVVVVGRADAVSHGEVDWENDPGCSASIEYLYAEYLLQGSVASAVPPEAD